MFTWYNLALHRILQLAKLTAAQEEGFVYEDLTYISEVTVNFL